jgi:hypothetical protein
VGVGVSVDRNRHVVHGRGNRRIRMAGPSGPGQCSRGYHTNRPIRPVHDGGGLAAVGQMCEGHVDARTGRERLRVRSAGDRGGIRIHLG